MGERRDSNVSIPKSSEPRPIAPAPIASEVQSSEPRPIAPRPGNNAPISRQGARQFAFGGPSSGFTPYRRPPPLPTSLAPRMIQPLPNMGASSPSNCPFCQMFSSPVLESTDVDFSVHFLTIYSGEDLCAWMAQILNENGWSGCAVLAAHGYTSRVVIRERVQGLLRMYSRCYKILSLTGLYSFTDHHGQRSRGLNILFVGGGTIVVGTLEGPLIAHNRVNVVIAALRPPALAMPMILHHCGRSSSNRGGPGNTFN